MIYHKEITSEKGKKGTNQLQASSCENFEIKAAAAPSTTGWCPKILERSAVITDIDRAGYIGHSIVLYIYV